MFRVAGIDVFLHWSWLLVAVYGIQVRRENYSSLVWPVLEYVSLFLIVLLHEFGHALACRQVGGQANEIVLWPLGGVAYVSPPIRPGAVLWSIVAGPLVNVVLAPVLTLLVIAGRHQGWDAAFPNGQQLIEAVCVTNLVLLCFNLLPIYPLDGGQILQSSLWFLLGRAKSLMVATIIGFAGVAVLLGVAIWMRSTWFVFISLFILFNCWQGLMQARALAKLAALPRRGFFACPSCKQAPIIGPLWTCHKCQRPFDAFETLATCPGCGERFATTACPECRHSRPLAEWRTTHGIPFPPP